MKKSVLIRAALVCLLAVPAAGQVPAGPQEKMPLDGEVRVGRLDNGMTYYIRHYDNPRQRADFFIAHDVGALQEEDDQNGLAHFLEHMAFNGTKHFPGKGILNYLAANGVRFGYNVNAYTSRDRTVYNVSNVPLVREGLVDSLLLILHDWSYYIACEPGEIESERGVIREEWRRGNDARSRMARKSAEVEYDGSKYARRDVIGDMEIVNSFGRQTLIDFYHKWYRPDLQAVIVVGDVDVDAMERKIRDVMSSIPKAENPARKEVYDIPQRDKPRYGLVTDPETKAVAVKLIFYQPYPSEEERATVGAVRDELARKVFLEMARARLAEAEKRPDARYKRVVAVLGSLATCRNTFMLTALPKEHDMREALAGVLTDVEQIRRYGFSREEFEAARAKVARSEKAALEKYRLATNTDLAGRYVEHFTRNVPYVTPDDRTRIVGEQLDALTCEEVNGLRARHDLAGGDARARVVVRGASGQGSFGDGCLRPDRLGEACEDRPSRAPREVRRTALYGEGDARKGRQDPQGASRGRGVDALERREGLLAHRSRGDRRPQGRGDGGQRGRLRPRQRCGGHAPASELHSHDGREGPRPRRDARPAFRPRRQSDGDAGAD